ncbi:MAG: hypothetical protein M3493_02740 [Actinomycetota bacterium]|jgi:hypothetical protein|nr:hypothetical protein [Actinomycetota bacterium]
MTSDDHARLLPEQRARVRIDAMLEAAGWVVQDYKAVNLYAGTGVAVRELVTNAGSADYVLFVNRQAVGVTRAVDAAFVGLDNRVPVGDLAEVRGGIAVHRAKMAERDGHIAVVTGSR